MQSEAGILLIGPLEATVGARVPKDMFLKSKLMSRKNSALEHFNK